MVKDENFFVNFFSILNNYGEQNKIGKIHGVKLIWNSIKFNLKVILNSKSRNSLKKLNYVK